MERTQWLEARRKGVTGTDMTALVGVNLWKVALDVFLNKRGLRGEPEETPVMRTGTAVEPAIVDLYCESHAFEGLRVDTTRRLRRHPDHRIAIGTPDGMVKRGTRNERLLECKFTSRSKDWGEDGTDQVPERVLVQCMWYLYVQPRLEVCDVAALVAGTYREYRIARADDLLEILKETADEFWTDNVVANVAPPADRTEAGSRALNYLHKELLPPLMETTPEIDELTLRLKAAKEQIRKEQRLATDCVVALKERIGAALGVETAHGKLAWTPTKASPKWKGVAAEALTMLRRMVSGDLTLDAEALEAALTALVESNMGEASRRFNTPRDWSQDGE